MVHLGSITILDQILQDTAAVPTISQPSQVDYLSDHVPQLGPTALADNVGTSECRHV